MVADFKSFLGLPIKMLKLYMPNVEVNSKNSTAGKGFAPIR